MADNVSLVSSQDTVMITRPRQDALELAPLVEAYGYAPLIEPLLEIEPLPVTLPALSGYQGLVFTSANGVRQFIRHSAIRDLPVYCVGTRTADEARRAGFHIIHEARNHEARGTVSALNDYLGAHITDTARPLLHAAGADVAAAVTVKGLSTERIALYKAITPAAFSPAAQNALDREQVRAVLLFSPRTAAAFVALLEKEKRTHTISRTKALCLRDSMVESIAHLPLQDVQVAAKPDRDALLTLLKD